ncbi:MAG: hypothetical protein II937_14710 [Bacteroidales bacterium]|nr:hypothetical protein [Bacteroidales bacterium]
MSIFGNIQNGVFSGFGKPYIKLEFDDNTALLDFQKRMNESGEAAKAEFRDGEFQPIEGGEVLSHDDFFNIITQNPASNMDFLQQTEENFFKLFPYSVYDSNNKKFYVLETPLKDEFKNVFLSAQRLRKHIKNSQKHKNEHAWAYIKQTLKDPNLIYKYNNAYVFLKPFLTAEGKPFILYLSPIALNDTDEHEKGEVLSMYIKDKGKKERFENLYTQYIQGGGQTVYSRAFQSANTKSPFNLNGVKGEVCPFVVDFRLYCDKVKIKNSDNQIFNEKNLGAAGDLYLVRDLRTRARKEPGDVKTNKNLNFIKIQGEEIKNFNKDFYDKTSYWSIGNKINGYKYISFIADKDGKNLIDFSFYIPTKREKNWGDNSLGGYWRNQKVEIDLKKIINIQISNYDANLRKNTLQRIEEDGRKEKIYNTFIESTVRNEKDFKGWITDNYYNELRERAFSILYNQYLNLDEKNFSKYQKKLLTDFYLNPKKYEIRLLNSWGDSSKINDETRDEFVGLLKKSDLGKTANPYLYNNNEIIDCRGLKPTYIILDNYDNFFDVADTKTSFAGFGLTDTKKLISETCRAHWRDCKKIAAHLKGDSLLQSCFNLWHWLRFNIRYEYDKEGREEIRTPLRVWHDRAQGVDCDCLSVFSWCVLRCMGYDPVFELVAFKNRPQFSQL